MTEDLLNHSSLREPIALIGIGCRFPGGVNSPDTFWQLLRDEIDAITEMPAGRFDINSLFDPTPATPGKIVTREGGFLENIDQFDAYLFGISPREAHYMDPQQRLLLEVAWEALEDGGQVPANLAGSQTGVFIGMWANDYEDTMYDASNDVDLYVTTGGGRYAASGRLSYVFDFRGPSLTIDTACSSSLVAVHLACQSLWNRETTLAMAGGVNLILEPQISIGYSRSKILSPDARCKFGDVRANGYVRSEGVGLVVLKPLSQALADKDPIYALIRGGAVNNDGRGSERLVAPSSETQSAVLHEAYRHAGVSPGQVSYMEAHGTGTAVGDPVELKALGTVLAENRPPDSPCIIGSVKTNIGHTEAASGVAGLIKAALCLKHKAIPASLHFQEPNPNIPWAELPLVVQQTWGAWPDTSQPALAGVNSFGITGTNAHIVLQEPPLLETAAGETTATTSTTKPQLVPLSAHTPEALKAMAQSEANFVRSESEAAVSIQDFGYTRAIRRTHHDHRLALIVHNQPELGDYLEAYGRDESRPGIISGQNIADSQSKIVFVFSGQGSHWLGMGRQLLEQEPVFRQTLEQCEEAMQPFVDWSLLEQLTADPDTSIYRLNETDVMQPTLVSIEIGLATLWQAWGIEPDAVIGHSLGEIAAAYIAGALSLSDTMRIICARSRLMRQASGKGAMAVVELSVEEAAAALEGYEDRLSIALSNSPRSTVLSGDPQALNEIMKKLQRQDIFCQRVNVDIAFHSPQMDPLKPDLFAALADLQPRTASIPIYSTALGIRMNGKLHDADYWVQNLRQPVLFSKMVQELLVDGYNQFVEMSPHPILSPAIQQSFEYAGLDGMTLPSMRRNQPELVTILESLGKLYTLGYSINWDQLYPSDGQCLKLPLYPWQRERFWIEPDQIRQTQSTAALSQQTLAAVEDNWLYEVTWEPVESSPETALTQPGTWIIFTDEIGTGQMLAHHLRAQNQHCVLVSPGTTWAEKTPEHLVINPVSRADIQTLLSKVNLTSLRGVIHLWSLNAPVSENLDVTQLEETQQLNNGSVLNLLQTLAQSEEEQRPRLWLVTQGAQPVTDSPLSVAQSPLWGFGRVIAEEHPEFWGGLIDLDPAATPADNSAWLVSIVTASRQEDQLAQRNGQLYAARLTRMPDTAQHIATPFHWRTDSTYLITGGLGDVGLAVARWAIKQGARRLLLLGRTPIPPRTEWNTVSVESKVHKKIAAIKELEALGASIHTASVDIADPAQVAQLLDDFAQQNWPPLRGVFHAAGILKDRSLLQLDHESLMAVLRPKIQGGWILHTALPQVECFVLFSSINSLIVQPGQSNYAAANAFLDALAHYRRQQDLPATCINWGVWQDLGMLSGETGERNARQMAQEGINGFSADQGVAILDKLLTQNRIQTVAISADWQKLAHARLARRAWPLLAGLAAENSSGQLGQAKTSPETSVKESLVTAKPEHRSALLQEYLQNQVAQVLRMSPGHILPGKPLGALGLDSLMAVEMRNRLEAGLGLKLSATLVWNYPTIDRLAPYLIEKMNLSTKSEMPDVEQTLVPQPASMPTDTQIEQLITDIETLADEDALQSLLNND